MSLIELTLKHGKAQSSATFRPRVEVLEARECLTLATPTWQQLVALSGSQVKLTWNDVTTETGYRVMRWDGTKAVTVATLARDVRTYTVGGLSPQQVYWFSIEAFNATEIKRGVWMSVRTSSATVTSPTLRVVGVTQTQVTLGWNATPYASGYRIFLWTTTGRVQIGTAASTATSYAVSNLLRGKTYWFQIQAYNAISSANSQWVSVTTRL